jgi:ABC-2 type transport system ATP-binding protein
MGGIIDVADVAKAFGETEALRGVDLTVPEGSIQGLLGPNGAGKTTLVRILATLLLPDRGRAHVAGFDVVREAQKVREVIGLAGQFAAVDELLTGRENLEIVGRLYGLPKAEARRRAIEALERLELAEAADRMVRGYSGGMRRRLDLGASLVGRPRVLILDEPTTGLDPRTRNDLWDFLRQRVTEGTTLLLTTQYLEEADQLCDHIVVVDHGLVIAQGTADELKSRLGADVIDVRLGSPDDLARAVERASTLCVDAPHMDEASGLLHIPVTGGAVSLLEVVRAFDDAGIVVKDVNLRRPSLDDVFLALTGHAAEAAAEAALPASGRRGRRGAAS